MKYSFMSEKKSLPVRDVKFMEGKKCRAPSPTTKMYFHQTRGEKAKMLFQFKTK